MPTRRTSRCASCAANPYHRPYVTMWNTLTNRKVAGTAAPCPAELEGYLRRHKHIVVYKGQDAAIRQRKATKRERERKQRTRQLSKTQINLGVDKENIVAGEDSIATEGRGRSRNITTKHGEIPVSNAALPRTSTAAAPSNSVTNGFKKSQRKALAQAPSSSITNGSKKSQRKALAQTPQRPIALVHPYSHIALAQRIWTAEARAARRRQLEDDDEEEIEELNNLRRIRRRFM